MLHVVVQKQGGQAWVEPVTQPNPVSTFAQPSFEAAPPAQARQPALAARSSFLAPNSPQSFSPFARPHLRSSSRPAGTAAASPRAERGQQHLLFCQKPQGTNTDPAGLSQNPPWQGQEKRHRDPHPLQNLINTDGGKYCLPVQRGYGRTVLP